METKDETQKTILEEVISSLQKQKRKIQVVDYLVVLAVLISLTCAIIEPLITLVGSGIALLIALFYLWLRSDAFEPSDKKKTLQLLELAVRKTKTKISYIDYFGIDSGIKSYILDLAPSKNMATLYVRLKEIVLTISIEMEKKNRENILYVSPLLEELMILFFQEIAMLPIEKKEKYLEEIKKLDKFFSRF